MSFHVSAEDIRIEDNHILKARLANADGEWVDAELDLNEHIGNDNGSFFWGGTGFADSAEDIIFSIEGDDSVPVLRANLFDVDGNAVPADVNLAERIENNDGAFVVVYPEEEEVEEE